MLLFVNACVRQNSRTKRLADRLLSRLGEAAVERKLAGTCFPETDELFLIRRDELIHAQAFSDPMFEDARQFAAADTIVIAAPYWDLSFPAALKQYLEQINVTGVTFTYTPEGIPQSLCRAKRLFYVTTAGGPILSDAYGYGYVRSLAQTFYGIPEIRCFSAEGLDLVGADVEGILRRAEAEIDEAVSAIK